MLGVEKLHTAAEAPARQLCSGCTISQMRVVEGLPAAHRWCPAMNDMDAQFNLLTDAALQLEGQEVESSLANAISAYRDSAINKSLQSGNHPAKDKYDLLITHALTYIPPSLEKDTLVQTLTRFGFTPVEITLPVTNVIQYAQ